jgi:glycosyltransferase involved in cell wall biosynthesis
MRHDPDSGKAPRDTIVSDAHRNTAALTINDSARTHARVSIIIPAYNELDSVEVLYSELKAVMDRWTRDYELVFVNDGSTDATGMILDAIADKDEKVQVVHFRRNYGQTAALSAGMDYATGDVIVPIDADLQNDPSDIPKLVERLESGFDVVSGWRKDRSDNKLTRVVPSRLANWLISTISGVRLHDFGCTLKAYRREVMEGVRLYGEMHRFVPIYAYMQGGRIDEMVVSHRPRRHGKSKYGLSRAYKVLLDLLLVKFLATYSAKPIYVFGGFGLVCLLVSLLPIGLAVYFKLAPEAGGLQKDFVETPLPVIAAVFVVTGMLAILQGLLAEVMMRTYFESQGKRTYVVRRIGGRSGPMSGSGT